jgi:hypothetical protein
MENTSLRRDRVRGAIWFGVLPSAVGAALGLYFRWADIVWLTSAGGFWPVFFLVLSATSLLKRAVSPFVDNVVAVAAWLSLAWTWAYVPLWLTAVEIPQSSAVVGRDGRVFLATDEARRVDEKVWLLNGPAGRKIVHGVTGMATVSAMDVRYRFADRHIARSSDGEDLVQPLLLSAKAALSREAGKSRSSRIELFEKPDVHARFLAEICRAVATEADTCPVKVDLSPRNDATLPGATWSRQHDETEAIAEQHVPTLVRLLTQEGTKLVDVDVVAALALRLAHLPVDLSRLAQNSRLLDDDQFDALIRRIIASPSTADEAVTIAVKVNRLSQDQRRILRTKALREAGIGVICHHAVPLHISDAEVALLAARMPAEFETDPQVAVLALRTFGERLPADAQRKAVKAIVGASPSHALAALRFLNYSPGLRRELLQKVLAGATIADFSAQQLDRGSLEDMLTPLEMRSMIASAVKKSELTADWLKFAVQAIPPRRMTPGERKSVLQGLQFESHKTALEFASENRQYLESADINEVTRDYSRTIATDLCLHLSHRNSNRKIAYFSDDQLQIFRNCAQRK